MHVHHMAQGLRCFGMSIKMTMPSVQGASVPGYIYWCIYTNMLLLPAMASVSHPAGSAIAMQAETAPPLPHALHRWGGGLFLGPMLGRVGDPGAQTHNCHNQ